MGKNLSAHLRRYDIPNLLIEGVLTLLLVTGGLCLEAYYRGLLFESGAFNLYVGTEILKWSLLTTAFFMSGYVFLRHKKPFLKDVLIPEGAANGKGLMKRVAYILNESFIIVSALLLAAPLQPVLQETFLETDISGFRVHFVQPSAVFTVAALLVVGIPLLFVIILYGRSIARWRNVAVILITIALLWFWNWTNRFEGLLAQSRANWVRRDWVELGARAHSALEAAKSNKERAYAYYWMGISENRQKNYAKAVEYQLQAIAFLPRFAPAHASLANGYLRSNPAKALAHGELCVEYDPKYAWCHHALGNYYLVTGYLDAAIFHYKTATDLSPWNRELRLIYEDSLERKQKILEIRARDR